MSSPAAGRNVALEPRVSRCPPYVHSSGDDACDLAAVAGLALDEWQRWILHRALGERPDGNWSATRVAVLVARQNGKGAILEARCLAGLLLFGEEMILWSAHEYKTAMQMFRRVKKCIRRLGKRVKDSDDNLYAVGDILIKVINQNGEEGFERLDTGAKIQFIARSKGAGRGFTADCIIWDEAYALTDEQIDAQMPMQVARPNAQIWYTSSPPLDAMAGAVLFRVRRRALSGSSSNLAYFDYGADGCLDRLVDVNLDSRELWRATNPAYACGRITEQSIQELRDDMSDVGFAREVLGIWPPDLSVGYQVIPADDWTAAEDRASQVLMPVALAAAVSLDRSKASIAAVGRRADGKLHVEITSEEFATGEVLLDNRPGVPWVVPRLVALAARHKTCAVVLDEFGPTGSLIPAVEEAGLTVTRIKTGDVGRAFGMFYDAVSGQDVAARNLRHLGQPELTAAVAGAMKRSIGDASAWDRRNAGVDITPLVAATNALWGYATRPQEPEQQFFAAWR
jgi:hypothetical protein